MFDPENFDAIGMLHELMESQHSVSLSTSELSILSVSLEIMRERLTAEMRGTEPEKVRRLSQMLGDVAVLENKIDTVVKAVLSDKAHEVFGEDDGN